MKTPNLTLLSIALLLGTLFLVWSCNEATSESKETSTPSPAVDVNPNGSSELALLMREMHDAAISAKEEIEKGQTPAIQIDFSHLATAEPTKPQMIDFEGFEPLATAYINSMQALANAKDSTAAAKAYTTVINTCMSCHQISCKGPIPRIRKLYLQP